MHIVTAGPILFRIEPPNDDEKNQTAFLKTIVSLYIVELEMKGFVVHAHSVALTTSTTCAESGRPPLAPKLHGSIYSNSSALKSQALWFILNAFLGFIPHRFNAT